MIEFTLKGTSGEIPVVEDLSNTERQILREMAQPGGCLWKVLRKMLDYGEDLKQTLVSADFTDPEQLRAAQKVQGTIVAIVWVKEVFESALTDMEAQNEGQTNA